MDTLYDLDVRPDTLTPAEMEFLDEKGYLNLGQLLSNAQVKTINDKISELMNAEGDRAGSELLDSPYIRHPKEAGADRLADLVNKGEVFDIFYTHPRVLAAIAHVLGPSIKLSSLNYRAAKPGMGLQKLHVDRSAKAIKQAISGSQAEIKGGKLSFRQSAIEEFELEPGERKFDLAVAVRVGALDGRHPGQERQSLQQIAKALTKNGKLYIDGGDPLKEIHVV